MPVAQHWTPSKDPQWGSESLKRSILPSDIRKPAIPVLTYALLEANATLRLSRGHLGRPSAIASTGAAMTPFYQPEPLGVYVVRANLTAFTGEPFSAHKTPSSERFEEAYQKLGRVKGQAGRRLSLEEIVEFGRQQAFRRLDELARLESDWDTYGGEPPTAAAIAAARDLIEEIHLKLRDTAGGRSLPFAVVPLSGGGVQIEYRSDHGSIEVEIGPEGELGYLLATGSGPERKFKEEDGVSKSRVVELVSALAA